MKISDPKQSQSDVRSAQLSPALTGSSSAADRLSQSPRMVAQRQRLRSLFGEVAQRQASFPPSTGLPAGLKAGVESLSGMSLDHVKVHYNSSKPAQLNALAYAQGSDIHVAAGKEEHLPHEAWHVVQQAQGRVQPTMQMAGQAVNDDAGLEREADTMGARALAATENRTQQGPVQRVAHTDHPLGWVTQLVNFPKDSVGSFSGTRTTIGEGNERREVSGGTLLDVILEMAAKAGKEAGYRLGSFIYNDGVLTRKKGKDDEDHGMPALPDNFDLGAIDPYLKAFVFATLRDAGQLDYLEENKLAIFAKHTAVIDVDCQFDRKGSVGFHKDSRGTTLFFSLVFNNQDTMQGPDNYEDLQGNPGLEKKLPEVVKEDIALRREQMTKKYQTPDKVPIDSPELPKYGRVSLSDPNLWHSTPLFGHRNTAAGLSREQLLDILGPRYEEMTSQEVLKIPTEDLISDFTRAYHQHNAEKASDLTDSDIEKLDKSAPSRGRRLSMNLDERKQKGDSSLEKSLAVQSQKPRTFIRTWVRLVPK
jgi:Domain of unknown function (DUF4157)